MYARLVRELQEEKLALTRKVDGLSTRAASLQGSIAAQARKDAVQARAARKAIVQAQGDATRRVTQVEAEAAAAITEADPEGSCSRGEGWRGRDGAARC